MTIEERISEIETMLSKDMSCLCGLPQCQMCIDSNNFDVFAMHHIKWLIQNLKACRSALNGMLTFYGMDENDGVSKAVHAKARKALSD